MEYEKNSLKLIFERVTPDRLTGVIETLIECYEKNFNIHSSEAIAILTRAVKSIKKLEK
jgi:hypothetical protein